MRYCGHSFLLLHFQLLSKPMFFRQNSERRSFKLPDIRKLSRDGTGSPSKISPPSTPSSPDDTFFSLGDSQNGKRRRKIPKVNLMLCHFCLTSSRQECEYETRFSLVSGVWHPCKVAAVLAVDLTCVSLPFCLKEKAHKHVCTFQRSYFSIWDFIIIIKRHCNFWVDVEVCHRGKKQFIFCKRCPPSYFLLCFLDGTIRSCLCAVCLFPHGNLLFFGHSDWCTGCL